MIPIRLGLILGLSIFVYSGCAGATAPASPSPLAAAVIDNSVNSWAPCVVVQSPGGAPFTVQMDAARALQRAGRMTWIRLNAHLDGSGVEYHAEARRMGLKILSIVHLQDLESSGWEAAFDRLHATYPSDIWEIAGEISNPDPNVNPITVTPAYYMSKFKNLYNYVKARYPGATLMNAPTFGTGTNGSAELEEFFTRGLLEMDTVVAINVYSNPALSSYATVIDRYAARLAGKRIWVTETGSSNPDNHIAWVQAFYPRLFNTVHPEMICWYAMWGGDGSGSDNGFGLLDRVEGGHVIERPLFKALTGTP
jgi:hypothetical protein